MGIEKIGDEFTNRLRVGYEILRSSLREPQSQEQPDESVVWRIIKAIGWAFVFVFSGFGAAGAMYYQHNQPPIPTPGRRTSMVLNNKTQTYEPVVTQELSNKLKQVVDSGYLTLVSFTVAVVSLVLKLSEIRSKRVEKRKLKNKYIILMDKSCSVALSELPLLIDLLRAPGCHDDHLRLIEADRHWKTAIPAINGIYTSLLMMSAEVGLVKGFSGFVFKETRIPEYSSLSAFGEKATDLAEVLDSLHNAIKCICEKLSINEQLTTEEICRLKEIKISLEKMMESNNFLQ